jgi:hypothetical protein
MTTQTSQKRIDANRRNAQKSTGPRTPEGKSRSRFNRLQHGLASTVPVLPGEDPAAFQARVDAVMESFAPQNQVEFDLLERVASTSWSLERARRAEAAQLCHKIRHAAIEREQTEKEEAIGLGERLFLDDRGPWQLYPHTGRTRRNPAPRGPDLQNSADPNNPALLILRLERTVGGCRWLLDRWAELRARLEPGEVWAAPDQFKAIRLLGKHPLDAVDDTEVIQIYTASFKLLPEGPGNGKAFSPLDSELERAFHEDDVYYKEMKKRPLAQLTPPDADAAREVLKALVDRHTSRLKLILLQNQEIAAADAAEAPNRLAFDPSHEGDKLRRYVLSAARLVNQTIKTYLSVASCPLSLANQDDLIALEPNVGRGSPDPARGLTGGLNEFQRTEPNAVPDGQLSNGQQTADNGQLTQIPRTEPNLHSSVVQGSWSVANDDPANALGVGRGSPKPAPSATEGLLPRQRTEPNPAPGETSENGERPKDNGRFIKPDPSANGTSDEGPRTKDQGQSNLTPSTVPTSCRGPNPMPCLMDNPTTDKGQRATDKHRTF